MAHSKMFDRIKGFYDKALWTSEMVREAEERGLITEEEYREITQTNS